MRSHGLSLAGYDKITGGKCKINSELVSKSKQHGGLRILNLDKFAAALRLRWLWDAWPHPRQALGRVGAPGPVMPMTMIFSPATKVQVGDGRRAKFWESPWLGRIRPKDISARNFFLVQEEELFGSKSSSQQFLDLLGEHSTWFHR